MRILLWIGCIGYATLLHQAMGWSFSGMFAKLVDDSYTDCLQSHSGFTSNYKEYCDNGKQLIEECDFDEDFECGGETDEFGDVSFDRKKRSLVDEGARFLKDYVKSKKDQLIDYGENKTDRLIDKTKNYTRRIMDKVAKYKSLFFSSSSFYELGKAYTQNCNDKIKEYFGTFRTDSKREYMVKIVCNKDSEKPYISELKTKGCVYIPKNLRKRTGECPVFTKQDEKSCSQYSKNSNATCAYDYACPSTQKCCSNGCEKTKICMNAVQKTTTIATTTLKYGGKVCSVKSKIKSYWNCVFKRKQCYRDDKCPEGTACCPTKCGNECLKLVYPNSRVSTFPN